MVVGFAFALAAGPATARDAKFTVTYRGNGDFTSHTKGHVTNNSGRCNDTGTEDTSFSFSGLGVLKVSFSRQGMTGDSYKLDSASSDWDRLGRAPSELTRTSTGAGCHPPDGSNISGSYDCTGAAFPQSLGVSEFKLTAAKTDERSHLNAIGPAEFSAGDFTGSWVYDTGSCGGLNGVPLLQTMANRTPFALGLKVPIREKTLRNLPVHHYFKVDVGEGHYAPQVNDAKACASNTSLDSCRQTFDWNGRVTVRRTN